jgi:hypothetical protein
MTAEAHCDCTGLPPWPTMMRLHGGGPHRYYLCRQCGAVREDVYQDGAIVEHRWHDAPDGTLPYPVRSEALAVLQVPHGEQLTLWEWTQEDAEAR